MYYVRHERKKVSRRLRLVFILIAACAVIVMGNITLTHMIRDTAVSLSKNAAARALNDAVALVIENTGYEYSDFVEITSDESGSVQYVSAKSGSVNRFKNELSSAVIDALDSKGTAEFKVPLGTLSDIGIFYGWGPDIDIKLKLYGDITTSLESTFSSAGINQTRHRITCSVSANVAVITPGFTEYIRVKGEYLVAETIIIGDIPDSYTDVNGDESGIVGQIFDYADIE